MKGIKKLKDIIRIDDTYTDDDIDNINAFLAIAVFTFYVMIQIAIWMGII